MDILKSGINIENTFVDYDDYVIKQNAYYQCSPYIQLANIVCDNQPPIPSSLPIKFKIMRKKMNEIIIILCTY